MIRKWRQRRWQRKLDDFMPSPNAVAEISRDFPMLAAVGGVDLDTLRRRAAEVLASKTFLGAGGFAPEASDCLTVALLAARPILKLGIEAYSGFHTFILYPGEFVADETFEDEDGLVTRGRDIRVGEAWPHGPVVLSMADVMDSAQGEGFDVVVHELAHQIDQLSGDMDGFPPLPATLGPSAWTRTFTDAFERLQASLKRSEKPAIDPYAGESPAEYFAVSSEYFFDAADWLQQHEPEVFDLLRQLYR